VILLDTHVAIWMIGDERMLGAQESQNYPIGARREHAGDQRDQFWEIAVLVAKDRLELRGEASQLRKDLSTSDVVELSVTGEIAIGAVELANLHADPADRLIAATAVAHDAMLMTADSRLLRWRHSVRRQNAHR
jgi:PIN domain nuclease of toxin-antitoxin system